MQTIIYNCVLALLYYVAPIYGDDSIVIQENHYRERPALISINSDSPNHTLLADILDSMCNLLAFYELAIKVNDTESEEFYLLTGEIMEDSCNWVSIIMIM